MTSLPITARHVELTQVVGLRPWSIPLPQNGQPLPQTDQHDGRHIDRHEPLPDNLAGVLRKVMSDGEKLSPALEKLLTDYLRRDAEDAAAGRTREHHERMLQQAINEVASLRTTMAEKLGAVDTRLAEHGTRLGFVEAGYSKLDKRIEKVEDRIGDVAETTGRFEVEGLKNYKKRSEKLTFALVIAGLTIIVTVVSAWLIAKAQIENAAPRSDPKELIGK